MYNPSFVISFLFFFYLLSEHAILSAQNPKADSLNKVIRSTIADTSRIKAMIGLTVIDRSKFDTVWIDSIYRWSSRTHFVPGVIRSLNMKGAYLLDRGFAARADPWLKKSLQISFEMKDQVGIVKASAYRALVFLRQGLFDSSEKYLLLALRNYTPKWYQ